MSNVAKRIGLAVAMMGLVAGVGRESYADLVVTYDFTGTVTSAAGNPPPGFAVGSTFTGTISYDLSAPASFSSPTLVTYSSAIMNFSVTAGTSTINSAGVLNQYTGNSINQSQVFNNYVLSQTAHDDEFLNVVESYNNSNPSNEETNYLSMDLSEVDANPTALSSTNLPGANLDLSKFISNKAISFFNNSYNYTNSTYNYNNYFQGTLTSLTFESAVATPEPSSLVSGGIAGLMGLGFAWRRHRKGRAKVATAA